MVTSPPACSDCGSHFPSLFWSQLCHFDLSQLLSSSPLPQPALILPPLPQLAPILATFPPVCSHSDHHFLALLWFWSPLSQPAPIPAKPALPPQPSSIQITYLPACSNLHHLFLSLLWSWSPFPQPTLIKLQFQSLRSAVILITVSMYYVRAKSQKYCTGTSFNWFYKAQWKIEGKASLYLKIKMTECYIRH